MNLQVKNVPPNLYERLRRRAVASRRTMSEVVLTAVERELARQEWHERLARRPATQLGVSGAQLLEQERRGRDAPLGCPALLS